MKDTTARKVSASAFTNADSPLWHTHGISATVTFEEDYGLTLEMTVLQDGHDGHRVGLSVEWYGQHAAEMVQAKSVVLGLIPLKREDGGVCNLEAWQSPEHFRDFVTALQRLADQLPYAESTIKPAKWGKVA